MTTELLISSVGAVTAITVSVVGAFLANRNSITLQTRKLKEEHYIQFVEALHNLASKNSGTKETERYVFTRDKLFIIASEKVIKEVLRYENEAVGKQNDLHDKYYTKVIKAIRKDLKLKNKDLPLLYMKRA